jgi:hypothetical protein
MATFSSFALPSTFAESTFLSTALSCERSTFGQPVPWTILPDLQHDLVFRAEPEPPVRETSPLSKETKELLQTGFVDVLAGRVSLIPDSVFEDDYLS